jgi:hypothetical protein
VTWTFASKLGANYVSFCWDWKLNMFPLVFSQMLAMLHVQLTVRTGRWYNSISIASCVLWRAENLRCSMKVPCKKSSTLSIRGWCVCNAKLCSCLRWNAVFISPPNSARESYGQGPLAPWVSSANCQADGSSGQVGCTLFVGLADCLAGVIAAG